MFQPTRDPTISAQPTDAISLMELVERVRARDHKAFEVLYEYYKLPIWRCLVRFVYNEHIAEELHQETFERVWHKLPEQGKILDFQSWLYKIAAHLAIDHLRRAKKFEFLPLPDYEEEQQSTDCISIAGFEEQVSEMECCEQALDSVSPRFRTCLLLYDQWGFSYHEIASLLEISVKCVSAYICRGREQFRKAYWQLGGNLRLSKKGRQAK